MADLPARRFVAAWVEAQETSPAAAAAVYATLADSLPVVAEALDQLVAAEARQRKVARDAATADMRRGPLRRATDGPRPGALLAAERHPTITRTPTTVGHRPR